VFIFYCFDGKSRGKNGGMQGGEGFWGDFCCLGGKKGRWNGVQKDHIISQYSVQQESQQLFATKYLPYLPTEAELVAEIEREKW
jgi:hypothetical protein